MSFLDNCQIHHRSTTHVKKRNNIKIEQTVILVTEEETTWSTRVNFFFYEVFLEETATEREKKMVMLHG